MTMRITIALAHNEPGEVEVSQSNGQPATYITPGSSGEYWAHFGNQISLKEVPRGTLERVSNERIAALRATAAAGNGKTFQAARDAKAAEGPTGSHFSGYASTAPAYVPVDPTSTQTLPQTQSCSLDGDQTCESCQ